MSDVDRAGAVDHRVVGLREDREATPRDALDEIHLPEWPTAIEGPCHEAADEIAELRVTAWSRERGAADVIADVEILIIDPHRVGQASRHPLDLLAVARDEGDPLLDQVHQAVEVETVSGRLEQRDAADVHRGGRLLEVEERHVEGAQPIGHRASSEAASVPLADPHIVS